MNIDRATTIQARMKRPKLEAQHPIRVQPVVICDHRNNANEHCQKCVHAKPHSPEQYEAVTGWTCETEKMVCSWRGLNCQCEAYNDKLRHGGE